MNMLLFSQKCNPKPNAGNPAQPEPSPIRPLNQLPQAVWIAYTVLHPILLHTFAWLHGKLTDAVATLQPPDFVSTEVVVQPATRQVPQTVPVEVTVGQLAGGSQGFVVVCVVV